MLRTFQRWIGAFGNSDTGAAWLSSARVVRCWVKSVTSATLVLSYQHLGGHSKETAGDKPKEGGDDVKSSWPYGQGYTCYNGRYKGLPSREVELIP